MRKRILESINKYIAVIFMVFSIVFYGLFTGVQKDGLKEIPNPYEFACYTMIFSSLMILPFTIKPAIEQRKKLKTKKFWITLIFMGISVQVVAALLKLQALKLTTATSVGFIASFSAVTLAFYAVIIAKEKLPKGFIAVLIMMVFGLILFRTDSSLKIAFGMGEILVLIFINITSAVNASVKNFSKNYSPYLLSFGRMFFAIIPLALLTMISGESLSFSDMFSKWVIIAGILFGLRVLLLYLAIEKTDLSNIAVFNILGPLVTFAYAYTFLNESLNFLQIVGAAIILLGVAIITKIKRKKINPELKVST